jgi:hypothetical protein
MKPWESASLGEKLKRERQRAGCHRAPIYRQPTFTDEL